MKLYNKILYPTDFSENSIRTMDYALKVSKDQSAELILLYVYRLINNGDSDNISHRNNLAEQGQKSYETVNHDVLKESEVRYTYLSEIGFIEDRIMANVKENDIDLVILCENVQQSMKYQNRYGKDQFLQRISCPIMFVPADL